MFTLYLLKVCNVGAVNPFLAKVLVNAMHQCTPFHARKFVIAVGRINPFSAKRFVMPVQLTLSVPKCGVVASSLSFAVPEGV